MRALGVLLLVAGCGTGCGRDAPPHPDDPCGQGVRLLPAGGACVCRPPVEQGRVWGTGQYTDDSAICAAALHAGAIDARGGRVRIAPAPGCPAYAGTTRNGVTTRAFGAWDDSFIFPGTATTACDQRVLAADGGRGPAEAPPAAGAAR